MTSKFETRVNRLEHGQKGNAKFETINIDIDDTSEKVEARKAEIINKNGQPAGFLLATTSDLNL